MVDPPAETLVATDRVRVHGDAADLMPEQARADGMPRFMDRDSLILLSRAANRIKEFVVFIDPLTLVLAC
jgi:hypothetical protein